MYQELYDTVRQRYGSGSSNQPMSDWVTNNTTIKRNVRFEPYPFQRAILDDMHPDLSCIKCSQVGLALALDTPVATTTGWTTMGEIQVGDTVFDERGQPTSVTYVSPIWLDRPCFDVEFDDGSVIRADASHRWFVKTSRGPFNDQGVFAGRGRPNITDGYKHEGVVSTQFLADNHELTKFYVPNAEPLELPEQKLPLDPWVLGLWLGDGHSYSARLTTHVDDRGEIECELKGRGYDLRRIEGLENEITFRDRSIYHILRGLGLIQNKHIPEAYLRGSREQRLDLLRGLLDTDGTITKRGRISFYNNNPALVAAVEQLVASLGLKARTRWKLNAPSTMKNGHRITPRKALAEVSFVGACDTTFFTLSRKVERQRTEGQRPRFTRNRTIVAVRAAPTVPTRCIQVDAPSHLFLAGRAMIPTHNTEVQLRKFLGILTRNEGLSGIFSLPNEDMYKRVYKTRLKPMLERDEIYNPPTDVKPIRTTGLIQIRDSFGYITGCGEDDATSIPADFVFNDEVDLSPEDMLVLFNSRMQNSDMRVNQKFSTPTFKGYGIDKSYSLTDQREYEIRCEACNHWQVPLFNRNFVHCPEFDQLDLQEFTDLTAEIIATMDLSETYVKCEKCHRRLDLGNADLREWVARYPSRTAFRGYYVRPFSAGRLDPAYVFGQLAKYMQQGFLRGFYNTVLGEPYNSADSQVQREDVEACMKGAEIPDISFDTPCFIGVDVGFQCHITISHDDENGLPEWDLFEVVPYARLETRISELRKVFNIIGGAIDRFPFEPTAAALRDHTQGLIMPVQWRGVAMLAPHKDELGVLTHYSANQTSIFDRMLAAISQKKMVIRGYTHLKETLITHLCDMVRDEHPDATAEATWKKTSGNDHFFHSMAFNLLSRRICEHMYQTQHGEVATSSLIIGANVGGGGLVLPGRFGTSPNRDRLGLLGSGQGNHYMRHR